MFEGRVFQSERVELKASSSVSKTLPASGAGISRSITHEAYCTLYSAPNYGLAGPESEEWFDEDPFLGWIKYFELYCYASFVETDTATGPDVTDDVSGYSLEIEPLGISASGAPGTYSDSVDATVEIDDYFLYAHNSGVWIVRFSEIRLYFNGGLIQTWTGPFELMGGTVLNPWSMPFIGVYPKLHGTVAATWSQGFPNVGPFSTVPFDWDDTATATQTGGGGIRWKQDGSWYAWAVTASTPSYPSVSGACAAPVGSVSAGDTWTTTYTQSSSRREVGAFCTQEDPNITGRAIIQRSVWTVGESTAASVWVWPDLERAIERWSADYKALWFRWGFPWATGRGFASYQEFSGPFPSLPAASEDSEYGEVEILGDLPETLNTVGTSAHAIEDPMGEALPMPMFLGGSYRKQQEASDTQTYQGIRLSDFFPLSGGLYTGLPPACPNPAFSPPDACFADKSWEWPYRVQTVASSGGSVPNVHKHRHPYVRLWSTWWNPHWSYGLWFPPDDAAESVQWLIEEASTNAKLYWLLIAQQHLTHPALPPEEDLRTRNFVLSEPLQYSGLRDLIQSHYLLQWTSWAGITRFDSVVPTIPSAKTLDSDSEDAWSFEDCSAVFGTDIVINPDGTGPGTAIATLDIGRWEDSAYQFPYLCKSIFLNWDLANVDAVRVYLVSHSGERLIFEQSPGDGFTTRNIVYDLPSGKDVKYAGSWGQDFGAGYIVDMGVDYLTQGESSAICADPERQFAFGLHPGRHGVSLRFEIDVTDRTVDATLHYPRWEIQPEDPSLIVETASTASLLYPDGPGTRHGQLRFWDYALDQFLTTPEMWAPGSRMSALDALCVKRTVFEAKAADDGLDAEIASLYENGIEYTQRAHLARDPIEQRQQTSAFVAQGASDKVIFVLVSSLRECPPLAGFPFRKRDTDWQPAGDHAQVSYSHVVEPRRLVCQGSTEMHMQPEGGPAWTSSGTAPSGWSVTEHTHEVDGTEADFEIVRGPAHIADARPWHGFFALADFEEEPSGACVSYDVSDPQRHVIAYIDADGRVHIRRSANTRPLSWEDNDVKIEDCAWVCIRWDRASRGQTLLILTASVTDEIELRTSTDEGREVSALISIATGKKPQILVTRAGLRCLYWIDGTAIKGQIRDAGGTVVVSTFTAVTSGVDDEGFGVDESWTEGGVHRIVLTCVSSGTVTVLESTDGENFS